MLLRHARDRLSRPSRAARLDSRSVVLPRPEARLFFGARAALAGDLDRRRTSLSLRRRPRQGDPRQTAPSGANPSESGRGLSWARLTWKCAPGAQGRPESVWPRGRMWLAFADQETDSQPRAGGRRATPLHFKIPAAL